MSIADSVPLHPLRFLVVKTDDGVVLKRGSTELAVSGSGAASIIEELVAISKKGASRLDIFARFEPEDRGAIGDLLDALTASRLFVTGVPHEDAETNQDVWYWQFAHTRQELAHALSLANIVVVGRNGVTEQLVHSLCAAGVPQPKFVSDPRLDDAQRAKIPDSDPKSHTVWLAEKHEPPTCVVAASSFGNLRTLLDYNRYCIERGLRFLPILLQNSIGYVGPLVLPGETPCLECAHTRWNVGTSDAARHAVEDIPPDAQDVIGFHPAMPTLLGDLAALELTKLFGQGLPFRRLGAQLEMNMLIPRIDVRTLLKVPRCPACSPLKKRPRVAIRRS